MPNAPGLDGVRGVAVVAVLAYHMDLAWTGGGFLGVEVFFALSGFLITQLIVDELSRTGRVDAWAFAKARARRLLPALVTCVVATLALFAWLAPDGRAAGRRAGLAALRPELAPRGAGLPYSEAFARPSPLLHLWSLSVEGQLYLLWPLLLVGVLATARRSTALLVTVLLAFASALLMALRYDPDGGSLAYYATDARASGFLVGAALAWVWRPPAWSAPLPRVARWGIDVAGIAALVTLVVGFVAVTEFDAGLYTQGGFLRVGLLAAVLIVAATRSGGVVAALLSRPPVVAVGRRSYGLYLYHWPVFVLGRELPLPPWKINLLGLLVTVAVAEASYRWIETPVRRGGLGALMGRLRLPRAGAVIACGAVTSALLAMVFALTAPVGGRPTPPRRWAAANLVPGAAPDAAVAPRRGGPGRGGGRRGTRAARRQVRDSGGVRRAVAAKADGGRRGGGRGPGGGDPAVVAAPPAAPAPARAAERRGAAGGARARRRRLDRARQRRVPAPGPRGGHGRRRQGGAPVLRGARHRRRVAGRRAGRGRPRRERHRAGRRHRRRHRLGGRPARRPRRRARAPPLAGRQQRRAARRGRRPPDRRVRRLERPRRRPPRRARARTACTPAWRAAPCWPTPSPTPPAVPDPPTCAYGAGTRRPSPRRPPLVGVVSRARTGGACG